MSIDAHVNEVIPIFLTGNYAISVKMVMDGKSFVNHLLVLPSWDPEKLAPGEVSPLLKASIDSSHSVDTLPDRNKVEKAIHFSTHFDSILLPQSLS